MKTSQPMVLDLMVYQKIGQLIGGNGVIVVKVHAVTIMTKGVLATTMITTLRLRLSMPVAMKKSPFCFG